MNRDDSFQYWWPAVANIIDSDLYAHKAKLLDKALGVTIYSDYMSRPEHMDYPLSDEMKELLVKLAGPHGRTVLRAYRIRKGLE